VTNERQLQRLRKLAIALLPEFWRHHLGAKSFPDFTEPMLHHKPTRKALDELDIHNVWHELEQLFGFHCPQQEWMELFGSQCKSPEEWEVKVGTRLTVAHLADFITTHVSAIRVRPMHIAGRMCESAGAFRAIEEVHHELFGLAKRFGPSTRIRDRLRAGKLERVWRRMRLISPCSIGPLRRTHMMQVRQIGTAAGALLSVLSVAGLIVLEIEALLPLVPALIATTIVGNLVLRHIDNRLPWDVVTFGDLARRMVGQQHARADKPIAA
jgi:hypothetical protein